jgi:predicted AlkP superfamily pyrophosphatase or phosphodiesterase
VFKKTVILVSIDGMRADYLDRGLTPHLLNISRQGLRAKAMKPIFPSITFPNHWTLMTGLYAESHGIIANVFLDPDTNQEFIYSNPEYSWNATWWGGEPIWETAEKAGITTANLMWPGPPVTRNGISPTYFAPFLNHVELPVKVAKIMSWLDLPLEQRPQLITVYEPSLDQAGHYYGPGHEETNKALKLVDEFARDLHNELAARNLLDITDIIFVSDHGMTDSSHFKLVFLDDILGEDGMKEVAHEDGWPSAGLRFTPKANVSEYLQRLLNAQKANPEAFNVYTAETMPARYHFSPLNNRRIAPIYVVPNIGWALTNHHEFEVEMGGNLQPKGNHGYDNEERAMQAIFVADGPFSATVKTSLRNERTKKCMGSEILHQPEVIEQFNNLEVYNLVTRLLGLTNQAPNNGTKGFWNKYLE